jgi:hypothetical protein
MCKGVVFSDGFSAKTPPVINKGETTYVSPPNKAKPTAHANSFPAQPFYCAII